MLDNEEAYCPSGGVMSQAYDPAGRTITEIRPLTDREVQSMSVDEYVFVGVTGIFLDDGGIVIPSSDPEGNGSGTFFTKAPDGTPGYLF